MSQEFPHGPLNPRDVNPPITPEHAKEVTDLIRDFPDDSVFAYPAAIIVAVFQGGMVKYLVDDEQVCETIRRLKEKKK